MTPLLSIIFLFIVAYTGSFLYQKYHLASTWLMAPLYSGSLNLVIGYVIGPESFGLLSGEIIGKLYVLVGLVLGWAGFLIGLQAKSSELKRFQNSYFFYSGLNFLLMLLGMIAVISILNIILDLTLGILMIILTAILGTVSSPILIGLIKQYLKLRGPLIHLLQFSVALDNMIGVIIFGLSMLLINQSLFKDLHILFIIFGLLIFSIFMAWLFSRISRRIDDPQQFFLVLIGFLLVLVGFSINLNLSVLLISFLFGVVLTNLPIDTRKLYQSIAGAEKPLYYLMMVFIGASISSISLEILGLALLMVILRVLMKYFSGYMSRLPLVSAERPDSRIGIPHIGMGGIALAMVLDFHISAMNLFSQNLLFIISVMTITNALLSTMVFKSLKNR